jgi:uncharacterized protein YbaP (TraB family)
MFVAKGPTLPERLSEAEWQSLSDALRARGMVPMIAAKMQPWLVAAMLEIPACMFPLPPDGAAGLDKQLIAKAKAQGLRVMALEPFDTALGIFTQFSAADQLKMLMETVATDAQSGDMAATLAQAYFSGESALFWEFSRLQMLALPGASEAQVDRDLAAIQKAMITGRNASWIPVLEAEAARGPVVAAFGALHLPGEAGVLNLLAARGWTISALEP